jgi:type II secretory pathway component HofQ
MTMSRTGFFCIRPNLLLLLVAFLICGADSPALAQQESGTPKINVNYQDADLRTVLRDIADQAGKKIVIGKDLNGRISLNLTNASLDQALTQALTGVKNFKAIIMGEDIHVLPIAAQSETNKKVGNTSIYRSIERTKVTHP